MTIAVTALEAAQALPASHWRGIALAAGALVLAVCLGRQAARVNRMILATAGFVALSTLCLTWLQERNEPRLLSPVFDRVEQVLRDTGRPARSSPLPPP